MHDNVVELARPQRAKTHTRTAPAKERVTSSARVLQLSARCDDAGLLDRVAPWLHEGKADAVEACLSSLFMLRLKKHIDEIMGGPTAAEEIKWKARLDNVKSRLITPVGNVVIEIILRPGDGRLKFNGDRFVSYIRFEGHCDALLHAGLAQPHWLHTGPRGGRRNEFEAAIIGAKRSIKIGRCRDRYDVCIDMTDEEHLQVRSDRSKSLEDARKSLLKEVDALPQTRDRYMTKFFGQADLAVRLLQMCACDSDGGFSLDDRSRAAILVQLDALRQAVAQATSKFDHGARRSEIACIAQRHVPSIPGTAN